MGKIFLSGKMQGAIPVIHAPFYLDQTGGRDQQVKLKPADVFLLTHHQHQGFLVRHILINK